MTPKMLKELQDIFADAARTSMWGTVEISFQNGIPMTLKQTISKKLEESNSHHVKQTYR
jgi:hypothetical protein